MGLSSLLKSTVTKPNEKFSGAASVLFGYMSNYELARNVFSYLKNTVKQQLFDNVVVYQNDDLFRNLEEYLAEFHPSSNSDIEAYTDWNKVNGSNRANRIKTDQPTNIKKKESLLSYRRISGDFIIKYRGHRIYVSKNREKLTNKDGIGTVSAISFFSQYVLSAVNGRSVIQGFLSDVKNWAVAREEDNNLSVFVNRSDYWNISSSIRSRGIDSIVLKPEIKSAIVDDVQRFVELEEWYGTRGIPYKRSYLLSGPPGNGKSSIVVALGRLLRRSIYVLDLRSVDNDEDLVALYSGIPEGSILLLEDIDSSVDGRVVRSKKGSSEDKGEVTYSTLLNVIDGVFYRHGLITIVTTNHPEKLESAFTRSGRMDVKQTIPNPGIREIEKYVGLFYNIPEPGITTSYPGYKESKSMSEIQESCLKNREDMYSALHEIFDTTDTIIT